MAALRVGSKCSHTAPPVYAALFHRPAPCPEPWFTFLRRLLECRITNKELWMSRFFVLTSLFDIGYSLFQDCFLPEKTEIIQPKVIIGMELWSRFRTQQSWKRTKRRAGWKEFWSVWPRPTSKVVANHLPVEKLGLDVLVSTKALRNADCGIGNKSILDLQCQFT